jgi:hypothetical protein
MKEPRDLETAGYLLIFGEVLERRNPNWDSAVLV